MGKAQTAPKMIRTRLEEALAALDEAEGMSYPDENNLVDVDYIRKRIIGAKRKIRKAIQTGDNKFLNK